MSAQLEESLFRTLAYFAYFQYPLTTLELWKWCDAADTSIIAIEEILLSSLWLRGKGVRYYDGFFGIGDVAVWRIERIHRVTDALRKSRKAERFVRLASWLPWVKMVAVCNSLAFSFTNNESDIDLFIVTQRGRIWSTRLILTGALALMRARPGECVRDPLCLSFFVTEDCMDLSSVKIGPEDPYLIFWIATLSPILDRQQTFTKFRAANGWIRQNLPRCHSVLRHGSYSVYSSSKFPNISFFERTAERIQRSRFPESLRNMMNVDSRVVVTDSMLKFHNHDKRAEILNAYEAMFS